MKTQILTAIAILALSAIAAHWHDYSPPSDIGHPKRTRGSGTRLINTKLSTEDEIAILKRSKAYSPVQLEKVRFALEQIKPEHIGGKHE